MTTQSEPKNALQDLASSLLDSPVLSGVSHPEDAVDGVRRLLEQKDVADEAKPLLGVLCIVLRLRPNNQDSAECPFWQQPQIDALPTDCLQSLATAATQSAAPPAIVGRIVDVAWYRRACSYAEVKVGATRYAEAAVNLLDLQHWLLSYTYVRRAVGLSAAVGRNTSDHRRLLDSIATLIESQEEDPLYFTKRVMHLLIDQRYESGRPLAKLAHAISERALRGGDYERAQGYLEAELEWYRLYKERDAETRTATAIAQLLEKSAEAKYSAGRLHPAIGCQSKAVTAWRRLGMHEHATTAQTRLHELQRETVAGFACFETTLDLSDCVAQARDAVTGKSRSDAILALAMLNGPMPVERLKEQARERLNAFPFYSFIPRVTVNSAGRVVNQGRASSEEDQLVNEARTDCLRMMELSAVGAISPAADQVQLEHGFTTQELLGLVAHSGFVPPARRWSFARGLALGFDGQYSLAAHLLMPQFENALRGIMEAKRVVVTKLVDSGLQDEFDLGKLLGLDAVAEFLGESEHFELETLLVHKSGANLRNELAHGLFDDHSRGALLTYFWWKVLRYVVILSAAETIAEVEVTTTTAALGDDAGNTT